MIEKVWMKFERQWNDHFFQAFVIYFLYENFEKEHSRKSW